MSFEEFQDGRRGGHLGYWNRTILAILNLYVVPMPPIKFQLNLTYGFEGNVIWRISRWPPSWISEWNGFSNSESPCHCDASHQVLAQSDLQFGRCHLKNFKMAAIVASSDIGMERFSNSESLSLYCFPLSFSSIRLTVWEEMSFKEFQDGCHGGHLGHRNRMILTILNLHIATMPPTKFQLNPTYGSGGDVEKLKS